LQHYAAIDSYLVKTGGRLATTIRGSRRRPRPPGRSSWRPTRTSIRSTVTWSHESGSTRRFRLPPGR